jgi:hypothetical protein
MESQKHKRRSDMPAAARFIAAAIGLFLIVGSAVVFLVVRPLLWAAVWVGIGAAGLGGDLLFAGIRGRWPRSVEGFIDLGR